MVDLLLTTPVGDFLFGNPIVFQIFTYSTSSRFPMQAVLEIIQEPTTNHLLIYGWVLTGLAQIMVLLFTCATFGHLFALNSKPGTLACGN
jgi:hypothetical protein